MTILVCKKRKGFGLQVSFGANSGSDTSRLYQGK